MHSLIDLRIVQVEKIVLVMDKLNTQSPASFYEPFEPAEAKPLSQNLEIHYTPTHSSWIKIAEIELSVFARQCLAERMPSIQVVQEQVGPGSSNAIMRM